MPILDLPPCRKEFADTPREPRIDWIVLSLFSSYGERIHPADKSLEGLLRLTRRQVDDLVRVLCGFVDNQAVKDGIRRWGAEFRQFVQGQAAAA